MDTTALRALVESKHQGVLVTLKRDGRPQLSNVAYVIDEDTITVSVTASRAKTKNLRRDPRASLYVGQSDFGAYAVVEGTAALSPVAEEPDDETVDKLVAYYQVVVGEHPDWDEYRRAMVDDERLVIELSVDRLYGMAPPSVP